MPDNSPHATASICSIVLREMLIAQDLTAMIAEARPDLQVRWSVTPDAALQQLADGAPVALALVDQPPGAFAASPLAARLDADRAMVVHLGHDPIDNVAGQPVHVLPYPFGRNEVFGLLAALPKK